MNEAPSKGAMIASAAVGLAFASGSAAIGAASADKHPSIGAFVGVGVAQGALLGLLAVMNPGQETARRLIVPWLLGTAIVGGGGAIGAATSSRRPALGAAIGAGTAALAGSLLTYAYGPIKLESAQKNGELQGAGVGTRYVVREGVFP